jgi:hypothetical protein
VRNIDYLEVTSHFLRVMMHGMETTDATLYLVAAEADTSATGFSNAGV